jgi:hypothetical protein
MFLLTFFIHDVRDVGVAGSNPVTPTTDFVDVFHSINPLGSTLNQPLGSYWGPVSRQKKHARFRLRLDANVLTDDTRDLTDHRVTLRHPAPESSAGLVRGFKLVE